MQYLNQDDWNQKYSELNAIVQEDFFKFETLDSYNDYGIYNWNEVKSSDILDLIIKAQHSVFKNADQVKSQIGKGVRIKRTRYLSYPLSKYILRQFSTYAAYIELGVDIDIIEGRNKIQHIKDEFFRDFLIFDRKQLLLIDNPNGCFQGGLYSEDIHEIQPFLDVMDVLEKWSVPFKDYMREMNLHLKIII